MPLDELRSVFAARAPERTCKAAFLRDPHIPHAKHGQNGSFWLAVDFVLKSNFPRRLARTRGKRIIGGRILASAGSTTPTSGLRTYSAFTGDEKERTCMIFDGLEKYIANSDETRGRTFHVTMSYFWIQMVHFGMGNMPPSLELERSMNSDAGRTQTLVADEKSGDGDLKTAEAEKHENEISNDRFVGFLLANPHLADGNLWVEYYLKEVLTSAEAKAAMMLPDREPLPNLAVRETVSSSGDPVRKLK
ncbi:hypothetical protein K438DRAFT_1939562 [Mycena galopus ATCC 62051]|nr:hypothetical protein K438DRAFT_1994293 [Mycena galopus ATCC 62051]KAF8175990.1 hypothetical protein K438DRAFT_1939562 [Mycena galopus ATCC 62051]